jgi:4a-hydroxytetrahydrobiopterin dehydratase
MNDLTKKKCQPCEGGVPAVGAEQARVFLQNLPGWELNADAKSITRLYQFNNFYETMAFVNALAYIAHQEDHHPDLHVSWGRCIVQYSTHAIGGLSENDFICAAKVNALVMAQPL